MADDITLPGTGVVCAADDISSVFHQRVKISVGANGAAVDLSGAAPMPVLDPALEIAKGSITGLVGVNKFGRSTNVDSGTDTDIHDGANATDDVAIWVAPTAARVHQIASNNIADDGSPVGSGARTLRVYGLTGWGTAESSEDITMNGTTDVATSSSYVIIHRMKVLTKGVTNTNVGVITATADTDGTVTAQINVGEGQTQMALYGIPSTQTLYLTGYYASAIKGSTTLAVEIKLMSNPEPDSELVNFLTKHTIGLVTDGSNYASHKFSPYYAIAGPAIIKIQGNASANDTDVSAGFDGILVTN